MDSIDLSLEIAGVKLENPIIVTAGEITEGGDKILKISKYGPGAIITKTISSTLFKNPRPCFASLKIGFINSVGVSIISPEQWFEKEIKKATKGHAKIIANVGGGPQKAAELASKAEESGADMIEIGAYACPNVKEIYEATYPGSVYKMPDISNPISFVDKIKAVKEAVAIPVIVKLSPVLMTYIVTWARTAEENGADALTVADGVGPVLAIDIKNGQPLLGGPRGFGVLSGPAIKPLCLRMVYEVAQSVKIPVIGIGGISTWQDALEFFMAGARCIGVHTATYMRGPQVLQLIKKGIIKYMEDNRYKHLSEIIGLTKKKIDERITTKNHLITTPIPPTIICEKCTACKICEQSCIYDAISVKDCAVVDESRCYGCGLCATVCPTKAIELGYYH